MFLLGFGVFWFCFEFFFSSKHIKFLLVFGPSDFLSTESHYIFVILLSGFLLLPMVINSPFFSLSFRQSCQLVFFPIISSYNTWGFSASAHSRIPSWKISSLSGLQDWLPRHPLSQGPKQVCPPEVHISSFLIPLLTSPRIENYNFMISMLKMASSHSQALSVCKQQVHIRKMVSVQTLHLLCTGWEGLSGVSTYQFARFQADFEHLWQNTPISLFQILRKNGQRG